MKHLLLTGKVQVGKSTALKTFLEKNGISADGYHTVWLDKDTLAIQPYEGGERKIAAVTDENGRRKAVLDGFEYGAELVENSGTKDVTVFDELGRLERCSERFMNAVLEKLRGEKPVLGVIKRENNEFLDKIRAMPNIVILEVTEENRGEIPRKIEELMK